MSLTTISDIDLLELAVVTNTYDGIPALRWICPCCSSVYYQPITVNLFKYDIDFTCRDCSPDKFSMTGRVEYHGYIGDCEA